MDNIRGFETMFGFIGKILKGIFGSNNKTRTFNEDDFDDYDDSAEELYQTGKYTGNGNYRDSRIDGRDEGYIDDDGVDDNCYDDSSDDSDD